MATKKKATKKKVKKKTSAKHDAAQDRAFRFFDNREKYLMFVTTRNE